MPAKAVLSLAPGWRAPSLASQLLQNKGGLEPCTRLAGPFAGKPAPMYGLAPYCLPAFKKLPPRCIYVLGLFEEAVVGFWPKLEELVACRLQSGLEGQ